MWKWLSRLARLTKRAEGSADLAGEFADVVRVLAELTREEARWGTVPRGMKDKARSELGQATMRAGAYIDGFPET